MPDIWETANGLAPFFNDASADYDGDGLSNLQEYLAGTNPLDPQSCLNIEATQADDGIHLKFPATAGRSYTLQYRDAVQASQWNRLTNVAPQLTGHEVDIVDLLPVGGGERFYRLTTPQLP